MSDTTLFSHQLNTRRDRQQEADSAWLAVSVCISHNLSVFLSLSIHTHTCAHVHALLYTRSLLSKGYTQNYSSLLSSKQHKDTMFLPLSCCEQLVTMFFSLLCVQGVCVWLCTCTCVGMGWEGRRKVCANSVGDASCYCVSIVLLSIYCYTSDTQMHRCTHRQTARCAPRLKHTLTCTFIHICVDNTHTPTHIL